MWFLVKIEFFRGLNDIRGVGIQLEVLEQKKWYWIYLECCYDRIVSIKSSCPTSVTPFGRSLASLLAIHGLLYLRHASLPSVMQTYLENNELEISSTS